MDAYADNPMSAVDSSAAVNIERPAIEAKGVGSPAVTIFSIPKPFGGQTDTIQLNAINSWKRLGPKVEVLLIGDEPGIAETAAELDVRHAGNLQFNANGTPLVSSAFEIAHAQTDSPLLAYCNCDVMLFDDFVTTIERLQTHADLSRFVAFGPRIDLPLDEQVNFDDNGQVRDLLSRAQQAGTRSSNVCKEYFVFPRELYHDIPPFAVGRGNWDNWMIHSAKQLGFPVVSVTDQITAIHQAHDYRHTGGGRLRCYVTGEEAAENQRLAGGRHLVSGSVPTWRLHDDCLTREPVWWRSSAFWADVPRFVRLLGQMLRR